jgi:hypothetical protein
MESKVEEPPQQEQPETIAITAPVIEKPVEPTEPVDPKGDQPDSDDVRIEFQPSCRIFVSYGRQGH